MDNYRDIINHALERESRSYKRSGWAWLVSRAPRPIEPPYWFIFIVASAPFAWWPLLSGVIHTAYQLSSNTHANCAYCGSHLQ